ncbi:collagen alpha-1(IV) chain-like [Ceratina calcarata]|uniref:Collagen alpha-1(IV) chain-like n=1 Tax=Ceratina calcarata TaxID=156304 RepID=A0AAJ7S5C3_9HYME|nr:collagen alpha-1(IV) chain-like [Ceratina calcarata]
MPACEPWCPLVKLQLKKLAKEAPWILKKEAFAERAAVVGKELDIYDADWGQAEQFVDARTGLEDVDARTRPRVADARFGLRDVDGRPGLKDVDGRPGLRDVDGRPGLRDVDGRPGLRDVDGRPGVRDVDGRPGLRDVDGRPGLREVNGRPGFRDVDGRPGLREVNGRSGLRDVDGRPGLRDIDTETLEARRAREEIATQWSAARGARDQLVETDAVDRISRHVGEPGRMDVALDADAATVAGVGVAEVGVAAAAGVAEVGVAAATADDEDIEGAADKRMFLDECDPHCPRRISRKERLRRLDERQRIVDDYLLNKGFGYFDDVCTCSLSCVIRALRDDTFVRSILASALLFTLGLKLCEELDAWYMPSRSS